MKDYSFGTIPIFKKIKGSNEPYFLIVKHSTGHWSFPKGHKESDETDTKAAERELFEETGIKECQIIDNVNFIEKYSFTDHNGTFLDKTVTFYPVFTDQYFLEVDEKEIIKAKWLPFDKALDLLTFKESKNILIKANEWLKSEGAEVYKETEITRPKLFRPTLKALIETDNKILLLKDPNNEWEFPGGKLDMDESFENGMTREIKEELNINNAQIEEFKACYNLVINYSLIDVHFLVILFKIRPISLKDIKISHEHQEWRLFDKSEIIDLPMRDLHKKNLLRVLEY